MLKILVAYHKKLLLFKNDILVTIHLGRTLKKRNKRRKSFKRRL